MFSCLAASRIAALPLAAAGLIALSPARGSAHEEATVAPPPVVAPIVAAPAAAPAVPAPAAPLKPLRLTLPPLFLPAPQGIAIEYAVGVGAAALTVPTTLLLGQALGGASGNLIAALVPSLLLFALLPPAAVTFAEWLVGRKLAPGSRFLPAYWATLAIHVVGIIAGSLAGVWAGNGASLGVFSLLEALALPAGTTLVMHYRRRPLRGAPTPSPAVAPRAVLPVVAPPGGVSGVGLAVPVLGFSF